MNTGYAPKECVVIDGLRGTDSICVVQVPMGFQASPCTVQTLILKTVPAWMETAAWASIILTFPQKFISALSSFKSKYECIGLYYYLQHHPWGMKSFCVLHAEIWQPREAGVILRNSCSTAKY